MTRHLDEGRTIGFGDNPMADLSDIHQRMPFVLKAGTRFLFIQTPDTKKPAFAGLFPHSPDGQATPELWVNC